MTTNHNYYLDLAFQLAEKNLGHTGLNPSVGTIVVKNDTVISSGYTSVNGRPHAEFNALHKIKNCEGSTLYTTLEPCTHHGKTPPCVDIIKKKKIKKVFYGFEDPDMRTFKKAKKFFKIEGIKSKLIHSTKYKKFYKSYFLNKKNQTSFVAAKIAISKDFFTINKRNKWITNELSRKTAHLIRNNFDCILSTSRSINVDNSLLNCRINGLNDNKPDLFIIDLRLKLKKRLLLNNFLKKRKTFIITTKYNSKKSEIYKKLGYKLIFIDYLKNRNDFERLKKKIYKMGYSRILIETGLVFLNYLLKNKLIQDLYIFKNNTKLGKYGSNNGSINILKKISAKPLTISLNGDKLFKKEF